MEAFHPNGLPAFWSELRRGRFDGGSKLIAALPPVEADELKLTAKISGAGAVFPVLALLTALTVGTLATNHAALLKAAFPATAIVCAIMLLRSQPLAYLGLVWWLWILTPEVRRLIDAQTGWDPTNPIVLTPYLVTALSGLIVLRHFRKAPREITFPFLVIVVGLFSAYVVGIVRTGILSASFGLLDWLLPPLLACYLLVTWRDSDDHQRLVAQLSVVTLVVVGLYGIVQFFLLPAWDRAWMMNAPIGSIGRPEPEQFRIFATLNSPGPVATVLMVLLLFMPLNRSKLKPLGALLGCGAFALTLVRGAWLGASIGLAYLLLSRTSSARRVVSVIGILIVLSVAALSVGPVGSVIAQRAESLQNISADQSFQARLAFYADFAAAAVADPIGSGIGSTGTATKLSTGNGDLGTFGNFDSGLLQIPFVLGWLGGLLYVLGAVTLVGRALNRAVTRPRVHDAGLAICLAALIQLVFYNVLVGVSGVFVWMAIGLMLAGDSFEPHEKRSKGPGGKSRPVPPASELWMDGLANETDAVYNEVVRR